jgi:hypothetical protein
MLNKNSTLSLARADYESAPHCQLNFAAVLSYAKAKTGSLSKKPALKLIYASLAFAALVGVIVPTSIHFATNDDGSVNPAILRKRMLKAGEEYFKDRILPEGLSIGEDYGVFGNCYVARFDGMVNAERLSKETIVSISFLYTNTNTIMAFDGKSNELRTMTSAYCDLWLDRNELGSIREKQYDFYPWLYDQSKPEDFWEINRSPIVLQKKEKWNRQFSQEDALDQIDVTIDPLFVDHRFVLNDFKYDGFSSIDQLTTPNDQIKLQYRLTLKNEGEDQVTEAVNAIKDFDFVQYARPSVQD